jgi:phage-related protein
MDSMEKTRTISWIKAARKDFNEFPEDVQDDMLDALTIAAEVDPLGITGARYVAH